MEKVGLISLYDYLGYAAGGQLGKEVAAAAMKCKETIAKKAINTRTYTGDVLLYRREFLKEYFTAKQKSDIKYPLGDHPDYIL